MHPVALSDADLLRHCDVHHTRRSGPGGQRRNKVETAVVLTHRATGIRADASERRSQAANKKAALFRLRLRLALHVRSPIALGDPPSELWRSRCAGGKIAINPGHADFPPLLAEVLDQLEPARANVKAVAEHLKCTSSQLVRFIKLESRAFRWLNELRASHGLGPLK